MSFNITQIRTLNSFKNLFLRLLPVGILWKNIQETFNDFLEAFAVELFRQDSRITDFQKEIIPLLSTDAEMLSDWERIALLPDEYPADGTTEAERQGIVHTKMYTQLPGPTESFFISYAAGLNITITSITFVDRFRVGISRVGDNLRDGDDAAFIWVVNYTGGTTAERIAMQLYFNRLKPAHTRVEFNP